MNYQDSEMKSIPRFTPHVEEILLGFDASWDSPDAAMLRVGWPVGTDSELLLEVIRIDLDKRRVRELEVSPAFYLTAFPELLTHTDSLELLFKDVHSASSAALLSTDSRRLTTSPRMIGGRYLLVSKLGEGGMGEVWSAHQTEPVRREVALKLIRPGFDSLSFTQRFAQEQQALALMDHPNIAKVYDGGVTAENRPYLVMELVDGLPLTSFCDENKLNVRERLELFIPVCRAVQHAHMKGVVHRDLKPSNILVTRYDGRPVPKVIDFGVAKAADQRLTGETHATGIGTIVGTLEYMAPEQASITGEDIDTRADVYSLGVVLYELLTGVRPHDRAFLKRVAIDELVRLIREVEPERPSLRLSGAELLSSSAALRGSDPKHLASMMRGELDWVVMRCLEKRRERRYETASALAIDLERYLSDEPVEARPPSAAYRLSKAIRRNKGPVTVATLVLLTLIAGIIGTTSGMLAAMKQERLVGLERDEKEAALSKSAERARLLRREVDRYQVDCGLRMIDRKSLFEALLWFAAPLSEEALTESRLLHMLRLNSYWRQQECPILVQMVMHQDRIAHAVFSPRGDRVVTASRDGTARLSRVAGQTDAITLTHDGEVLHAAFSTDGRQVITASGDGTARLWDAATGRLSNSPLRHPSPVQYAMFSPSNTRVMTVSNSICYLWNLVDGREAESRLLGKNVMHADFSSDGKLIATACLDGTVQVWDAATLHQSIPPLRHSDTSVLSLAFSPDGRQVATAGYDATAQIWDTTTGKAILRRMEHAGPVRHIVFSPDGRRVLTACDDNSARVWDAVSGHLLVEPLQHDSIVIHADFSPDGRRVVTASDDSTVRIWETSTGHSLSPPLQHRERVNHAVFSPDGRQVLTASNDHTSRIWDLASNNSTDPIPFKDATSLSNLAFSPNGQLLLSTSENIVQVWDASSGKLVSPPLIHKDSVRHAAFSSDTRRLLTTFNGSSTMIWNTANWQPIAQPMVHPSSVLKAFFSPDVVKVLTVDKDRAVRIWDADSGRTMIPPMLHESEVVLAKFSPDSQRVLTVESNHQVHLWDANSGTPIGSSMKHPLGVLDLHFTPDGERAMTMGLDRCLREWNVTGEARVVPLVGLGHLVNAFFSPDAERILTVSDGGALNVWDTRTGQPISPPMINRLPVRFAAFSADSHSLFTCDEKAARLWDVSTGQPLTPRLLHQQQVTGAAFSPTGLQLATSCSPQAAQIWNLTPEVRSGKDWIALVNLLHGHRLDQAGGLVPLSDDELRTLWGKMQSRFPTDFTVTPEQAITWRQREIRHSIAEGNSSAARFHQRWLLKQAILNSVP